MARMLIVHFAQTCISFKKYSIARIVIIFRCGINMHSIKRLQMQQIMRPMPNR
jgi:hypothetical protein